MGYGLIKKFWVGDLNYRVDVADDILRAWVEEQKWNLVLEKDQVSPPPRLVCPFAIGSHAAAHQ
jgi:hypothetical protein